MPVISTKDLTAGNWLKREHWAEYGYCRKEITVNEAAETEYKTGMVLGYDSVAGKYKVATSPGTNGSVNAAAIFLGYGTEVEPTVTVPATTDTKIIALVKGAAIVGSKGLILDGTLTEATVHAELEALGINVDESL